MINTNPYYNPYAYGISQNLSTGMNNQIPAPMASNDIQKNPVAAPQEKKNVSGLGLRQLKDFEMLSSFHDSNGKEWKLVKSANDASVEIPDPQFVQVTDCWNHEFPNSDGKVFIYVVEGIKRPRVDSEKPVCVLYQWFSTTQCPTFNPSMISMNEWHRANVYTSTITDSRISKLKALCRYADLNDRVQPLVKNEQTVIEPDIDLSKLGETHE